MISLRNANAPFFDDSDPMLGNLNSKLLDWINTVIKAEGMLCTGHRKLWCFNFLKMNPLWKELHPEEKHGTGYFEQSEDE